MSKELDQLLGKDIGKSEERFQVQLQLAVNTVEALLDEASLLKDVFPGFREGDILRVLTEVYLHGDK